MGLAGLAQIWLHRLRLPSGRELLAGGGVLNNAKKGEADNSVAH